MNIVNTKDDYKRQYVLKIFAFLMERMSMFEREG
jgi:hypothetical protein